MSYIRVFVSGYSRDNQTKAPFNYINSLLSLLYGSLQLVLLDPLCVCILGRRRELGQACAKTLIPATLASGKYGINRTDWYYRDTTCPLPRACVIRKYQKLRTPTKTGKFIYFFFSDKNPFLM